MRFRVKGMLKYKVVVGHVCVSASVSASVPALCVYVCLCLCLCGVCDREHCGAEPMLFPPLFFPVLLFLFFSFFPLRVFSERQKCYCG